MSNISRSVIFEKAFHDCMSEMYAKSQPSGNYDELCDKYRNGEIEKGTRVYEWYYLSQEEFEYIRNKYIEAYGLKSKWKEYVDIIIEDLTKGGLSDCYVEDEDDRPGYRSAEREKPLKELIGEDNADIVIDLIKKYRDFYRFDREESDFSINVSLGASPTSNPDTVINYWKSKGVDVEIEERDPDTFWYRDEYGKNWEDVYRDELEELDEV